MRGKMKRPLCYLAFALSMASISHESAFVAAATASGVDTHIGNGNGNGIDTDTDTDTLRSGNSAANRPGVDPGSGPGSTIQHGHRIHRRQKMQQNSRKREPKKDEEGLTTKTVTLTSTTGGGSEAARVADVGLGPGSGSFLGANNKKNSNENIASASGGLFNTRTARVQAYIEKMRTIQDKYQDEQEVEVEMEHELSLENRNVGQNSQTNRENGKRSDVVEYKHENHALHKNLLHAVRQLAGGEDKDKDKDKDKNNGGGDRNKPNNNKPNNKPNNKGMTQSPSPSQAPSLGPTPGPTPAPTKYPTRSPVVLPWTTSFDGYVQVGVSIFTHEDDNLDILQGILGGDEVVTTAAATPSQVNQAGDNNGNGNGNGYLSVNDVLPRLNAGDILSGKEPQLIEDVLSTMATIFCQSMADDDGDDNDEMLLNVVEGQFYDYCAGSTGYEPNAVAISLENLPDDKNVLVTDITDNGTMLLKVEDRQVYVNNWRKDEDGNPVSEYLHWTVWTVSYAVIQVYSDIVDIDVVEDDTMRDLLVEDVLGQIQQNADQTFAKAISDGTMDGMLSDQSDNVLKVSSIGWEVETFTNSINDLLEVDENGGGGTDGGPNGVVNPEGEGEKKGGSLQMIQIVGVVLLLGVALFVAVLMKVGHERYKYEVWDATHGGGAGGKSDVNLVTYEGVDFMLDTGRHARAADPMLKSRSSSTNASPEEAAMDMGNSPSELVGQGPPPSPLTTKNSKLAGFMRRFGKETDGAGNGSGNADDDFTVAEAIVTPKIPTRWETPSNMPPPPPPPGTDSPTTSALLRNAETNETAWTPPRGSRRFGFSRGGSGRQPSNPDTPQGAERVEDSAGGGDFAFIAVSNRSNNFEDTAVRRSSTL